MRKFLPAFAASIAAGISLLGLSAAYAQSTAPELQLVPAATLPAVGPTLVPLAASADDLLFAGETQKKTVLFVAQAQQTAGEMNLVLNMQSAISSAPEASRLNVAVNDQDLGTVALKSGEPYALRLQLPPGLVQPGLNAVTFTVDQAHRVDCSLEATYELWTRIDPLTSGIEYVSTANSAPDFVGLLGAVRAAGGNTAIRGLLLPGTFGNERDRLIEAIQALSIAAVIDRPKVDFGTAAGTGPGIDIAVGSRANVAEMLASTGLNPDLHQGINIARRPDGRMVLAVVGEIAGDIDTQIDQLAAYASQSAAGSPAGLAALSRMRGAQLQPLQKVAFSQLGVDDRLFSGRMFRQSVSFRMPTDFYPADYARAGIHLDALYARGLTTGAELQFKLNGKTVSTVVLSGGRTGEIRDQILPVALTAFRPGLNEMTIEAKLPMTGDASCEPGMSSQGGGRLRIAGSSYLELPELARIGRFPDLGALDQSITGRNENATLEVVVDETPASLNGAATFLARLAYSANRIIDTHVANTATLDGNAPTLVVGGFGTIPAAFAGRFPLSKAPEPLVPLDALGNELEADAPIPLTWTEWAQASVAGLPDLLRDQSAQIAYDVRAALYGAGKSAGLNVDALRPEQTSRNFVPDASTSLLVAQQVNDTGTAPITLIAAPEGSDLMAGIDRLIGTSGWTSLNGSVVTVSDLGQVLQTVPPVGVQLYADETPTLANSRLIAAGWLSNNPAIYVALLLAFAAMLGLSTGLVLWRSRSRSQ